MKIVIATDSFKGSLTAEQACRIIACGMKKRFPNANIIEKPLADGGEGTSAIILKNCKSQWIPHQVMGPLEDMTVDAGFVWLEDEKTAFVEMACASGILLLKKEQLNPMKTTTFGTGQLIKKAVIFGAKKVILSVGGSATVDGGVGAAMALGWKFIDKDNCPIGLGGGCLDKIIKIIKPTDIVLPEVEVLCDVENELCGVNGAACIYGPQKGATDEMIDLLDKNLEKLAKKIKQYLLIDIKGVKGSGAAGGLVAGAIAFMSASVGTGIETIKTLVGFKECIEDADIVITGEGKFDNQSLQGKVISGVMRETSARNIKLFVIAGDSDFSQNNNLTSLGIDKLYCLKNEEMSLDYAIGNADLLLADTVKKLLTEIH